MVGQLTLSSSSLNFCMWYRRQMLSSAPFSVNCVFCWNTKHDHKYSPLTHSPWTACFAETSNPYLCELVSSSFLKWQTRESISTWKTSYKHNQKDLELPPDSTGLLILFHIVSFWNPPNHDWSTLQLPLPPLTSPQICSLLLNWQFHLSCQFVHLC